MAYFKLVLSINGTECKARVTFPNACYVTAGGRDTAPPGESVPAGELAYTCIYDYDGSRPCPPSDTTREWDLPYHEASGGEYLNVFLLEKSSGDVKDEEKTDEKVERDT